MNAFELISMSKGLNLGNLFDKDLVGTLLCRTLTLELKLNLSLHISWTSIPEEQLSFLNIFLMFIGLQFFS